MGVAPTMIPTRYGKRNMTDEHEKARKQLRDQIFDAYDLAAEKKWDELVEALKSAQRLAAHLKGLERG